MLYVGMGCFWGAERTFWKIPGVVTTAVGYQGGFTPFPSYEETCTGQTGHTEIVMVAYDPTVVSADDLLRTFWESHDPTQGYRQATTSAPRTGRRSTPRRPSRSSPHAPPATSSSRG